MPALQETNSSKKFYNKIAHEYNRMLLLKANEIVRQEVANHFTQKIPVGTILDFGGGTGLDLHWLMKNKYKIYFLEPAEEMCEISKKSIDINDREKVTFVTGKHLDFQNWFPENLPFPEKVDGILANFAVLNNIENLSLLFEKFALISNNNGYVVATVLNLRKQLLENPSLKLAFKLLLSRQPKIYLNYSGVKQKVYLHRISQLKRSAKDYFDWLSYIPLRKYPFDILILRKKQSSH